MQKVAAYLLERREDVATRAQRTAEVDRLLDVLQAWLVQKGAKETVVDAGTFVSRDGQATFRWERAITPERSWHLLRLDEISAEGRRFATAVSVTDTGATVAVYVSQEAGLVYSTIAPLSVQPKCPRFLRDMLDLGGDWYHGLTKIQRCRRIVGEDSGKEIAKEILATDRTLPLLLLSEDDGQIIIPQLNENLAHDLAGLANVAVLDHDAAWGVTEILGKAWSCYWGAVRVYWPRVTLEQSPYQHPLWTASKLLGADDDLTHASDRFRQQLRRMFTQVSALSVLRPPEIDEIRGQAARLQIAELQRNAASAEEFRQLAQEYADDNNRLRLQNEQLCDDLARTQTLLQNSHEIARFQFPAKLDFEPEQPSDHPVDPPRKGEIRFYKTIGHNDHHDIIMRSNDCKHNKAAFQSADSAPKGQKGIAHLEGRRDWKWIKHCGSCTGGGRWKVKW